MIRLTIPSIEEDDLQAVREVLATGFLIQGARVAAFEQAVAEYVGSQYAVAVSNCTAALHLALMALDVRQGDLVVVTTYSWPATANVIELCGAHPVFVDIQADTFNLDPICLEKALNRLMANETTAQRVKAILPVHAFGQMANMQAILDIAEQYSLPVIEDAACALGATDHGRPAGTWGLMGCFSFHPRKAITTGEGGMIVTDDAGLARRLRMLRNHGLDPDTPAMDFVVPGFNYRLTEFQAALGLTQMSKIERVIAARQAAAARYNRMLENTTLQLPVVAPNNRHIYQSYVALLPVRAAAHRAELLRKWRAQGIEVTIGTIHVPLAGYYRCRYGCAAGDFPVTDDIAARSITLPLYEGLEEGDQEKVVEVICASLD